MRQKKVWRYYCDHCGKGGCSKGHMRDHEEVCTLNPNRYCRMCDLAELDARPLPELIAALDMDDTYCDERDAGRSYFRTDAAEQRNMDRLRAAADGCPMCMLAALRQARVWAGSFEFASERDAVFSTARDARREEEYANLAH